LLKAKAAFRFQVCETADPKPTAGVQTTIAKLDRSIVRSRRPASLIPDRTPTIPRCPSIDPEADRFHHCCSLLPLPRTRLDHLFPTTRRCRRHCLASIGPIGSFPDPISNGSRPGPETKKKTDFFLPLSVKEIIVTVNHLLFTVFTNF
jgi:hypothetical protein